MTSIPPSEQWLRGEDLAAVKRGLVAPDPNKPRKVLDLSTLPTDEREVSEA